MAERARAGLTTAPLPSAANAPHNTAGMVIDPRPDDNPGPAPLDAPAETLPLTAHSSQTDSNATELTDPGDNPAVTSATSGPFHADTFLASVADGSAALALPVYPTAAPSVKRTLKRQTSKALDTAAAPADKAATKSKTDPPKFFQESDMVLYNHIGLAPPLAGKTASHQRECMIQNEVYPLLCTT
jgi:hypothetical protein